MTYDLLPSLENGKKLYVIRESFCVTYVYNLSLSKCYDNSCAQTFRMPSHDAYLRIEGSDQSGVLHNKRNREQRIRISIYQTLCIVEYTISDRLKFLFSVPFIVRSP